MKVINAIYGIPTDADKNKDVTTAVQLLFTAARDGKVSIFVNPPTFGIPDPALGVQKSFAVTYQHESGPAYIFARGGVDGDTINIDLGSGIEVASAIYASRNTGADVTKQAQEYFADPSNTQVTLSMGSKIS